MLLEKVMQRQKKRRKDVGMTDEQAMTAGLKDNLAWIPALYLHCLSYLEVLSRETQIFGEGGVLIIRGFFFPEYEDILVGTKCITN